MGLIKSRPRVKVIAPPELTPGETFEAKILLEADRPVPINALTVRFVGVEEVTVGRGDHSASQSRTVADLAGKLAGRGRLEPGVRSYPFSFRLPKDLPPSFEGRVATVRYRYDVHVDIPWWPDRRASFEARVGFDEWYEPGAQPVLVASDVEGPKAREPYVELSLGADVLGPGEALTGAVALGNSDRVAYRGLELALVGLCTSTVGRRHDSEEIGRVGSALPLPARGSESITFSRRLPEAIFPTWQASQWNLDWIVEVRANVLGANDVVLRTPVTVLPQRTRKRRERAAPPVVGRERVELIWRDVAREHGLEWSAGAMHGKAGGCAVTVTRETRDKGNVLLAELTYPSLRMGLTTRARLLGGRKREARDEAQAAWLAKRLPACHGCELEVGDERARLEQRGAGQDPDRLSEFVATALELARAMPRPEEVPPPGALEKWLPGWRALANVLEGTLHAADLSATGKLGGCEVAVLHDYPSRGRASTRLTAKSPGRLRMTSEEFPWDSLGEPAAELRVKGASLRALGDRLELALPLQTDPEPLLPKLRALARLARSLSAG